MGPDKLLGAPSIVYNNVNLDGGFFMRDDLPFLVCEWMVKPQEELCYELLLPPSNEHLGGNRVCDARRLMN
jgi:hypothetical protein